MAAAIYERLVWQLQHERGKPLIDAERIAKSVLTKRGHLIPGTLEATPEGLVRGNMTPEEREQDRKLASTFHKWTSPRTGI